MGLESWESFVVVVGVIWQMVPLCFFFFHEHMTTWSVHGRRVYKYPPNDHFSIGVCPTAHNCNIVVL